MRTLPLNLERRITMGLDQYGGWLQKPSKEEQLHSKIVNQPIFEHNCEFDWRKHAKLQKFMEDIWYTRETDGEDMFNGQTLLLTKEDILNLQQVLLNDNLPESEGGFFFGHQFQDESAEQYKEQDLEFCKEALKWLDEGKEVFYECSW